MKKIVSAQVLLLIISLSGCSTINDIVCHDKPPLKLSLPDPVKLDNINWIVINNQNYNEIIAASRGKEGLVFLVALDEQGYKKLSSNNAKILKYVREQKNILAAYKKYYEEEQ